MEEGLEGGGQGHEEGGPFLSAEVTEFVEQGHREDRGTLAASIGEGGGARAVSGDLERGHAGELLGPVVERAVEVLTLEPLALPEGVIGVLDRECGER